MKVLTCSRCKEPKGTEDFDLCTKSKRGFSYWCRHCLKERQALITYGDTQRCKVCKLPGRISSNGECDRCLKEAGLRECRSCGDIKALLMEFYPGHGRCKSCFNTLQGAYAKRHPKKGRKASKRYRQRNPRKVKDSALRHKYDITLAEYELLALSQDGLCWVCREPPDGERLYVDHDHETKIVRGLLCRSCNTILGLIERHPFVLSRFPEYLEKVPAQGVLKASRDLKASREQVRSDQSAQPQPTAGVDCELKSEEL